MSTAAGWRLAALQLLAAGERLVRPDRHETTTTGQLEDMQRFRERIEILRIFVEKLDARDGHAGRPEACDLVRNPRPGATWVDPALLERLAAIRPRGKSWVEQAFLGEKRASDWVIIDEVSSFKPEALDRVRSLREDRARRDWMHAQGMT